MERHSVVATVTPHFGALLLEALTIGRFVESSFTIFRFLDAYSTGHCTGMFVFVKLNLIYGKVHALF